MKPRNSDRSNVLCYYRTLRAAAEVSGLIIKDGRTEGLEVPLRSSKISPGTEPESPR